VTPCIVDSAAIYIMLDGVSLMPKRSSNNTGTNVHKSDTTVKGNLSRDTSQQLIPVSFKTCPLPLRTPNPLCNDTAPPRLFNTTTNDKAVVFCSDCVFNSRCYWHQYSYRPSMLVLHLLVFTTPVWLRRDSTK
jgi:hypothetical protein